LNTLRNLRDLIMKNGRAGLSTGLNGTPFPLSFSVREASGFWMVDAAAAQTRELADVLMRAASDTIVVVDLGTSSFLDKDDVQWPPRRVGRPRGPPSRPGLPQPAGHRRLGGTDRR
jgi:hypothetical protein